VRATLLLACVGPMQSWGTRSRFQERDTEREPSKSGVIGMLCAALGRDRSEPVDDLAALKMGVRVDREGLLRKDFQTARNVAVASGGTPQNLVSNRYYLADAAFLVGLEGDRDIIIHLHEALAKPKWPLFLGRKSYLPSFGPFLNDGLVRKDLCTALAQYPLLLSEKERQRRESDTRKETVSRIRIVLESSGVTHESRQDQPISYSLDRREFRERYVATTYLPISHFNKLTGESPCLSPS
jgi:CRISPR system Cascade subunit CasD